MKLTALLLFLLGFISCGRQPRRSRIAAHAVNLLAVRAISLPETDPRWNVLERKVQRTNAARAFTLFEAAGIEAILIKGVAVAEYYPENVARRSADMDLAVDPADHARAAAIAAAAIQEGLAIDLHCGLRHLDPRPWRDLYEGSLMVCTDNGNYRVLRPEDHLRVLAVHWLNDGGIYLERLWDFYYLITNRADDFNWDRVTTGLSSDRNRWVECVLGLCARYCALDLFGTPFHDAEKQVPEWLARFVENAWTEPEHPIPLWLVVRQPSEFVRQLRMRLNPNPIRATVEMEGSLDSRSRLYYKAGNLLQRVLPSLRRNARALGEHE